MRLGRNKSRKLKLVANPLLTYQSLSHPTYLSALDLVMAHSPTRPSVSAGHRLPQLLVTVSALLATQDPQHYLKRLLVTWAWHVPHMFCHYLEPRTLMRVSMSPTCQILVHQEAKNSSAILHLAYVKIGLGLTKLETGRGWIIFWTLQHSNVIVSQLY